MIREKPWSELFIAASMGVEYSVKFHHDIQVMLHDNSVNRWILPKTVAKGVSVAEFRREEKSNTIVFY